MGLENLLNQSCSILAPTYTADAYNAQVETFSVAASAVPCRLQYGEAKEMIGDEIKVVSGHNLWMSPGATIREDYRVTVGNKTFEVKSVNDVPGGTSHHIQCALKQIETI